MSSIEVPLVCPGALGDILQRSPRLWPISWQHSIAGSRSDHTRMVIQRITVYFIYMSTHLTGRAGTVCLRLPEEHAVDLD